MKSTNRMIGVVFFLFVFSCLGNAANVNYPYGSVNFRVSPAEDPIPGFGGSFSTLSLGMKSALLNPATLGKLALAEMSFLTSTTAPLSPVSQTTNISETSGTLEGVSYGIFFRPPANISGVAAQKIAVTSNLNYSTSVTSQKFSSALKVNDWLTIGFMTGNSLGTTVDLAGDFPTTVKGGANLNGQTLGQMQIDNDSKLKYTFTSGGTTTTYESQPLWSGFVSQEAILPLTGVSTLRNNFDVQSPFIATVAGGGGNVHFGLNMIPLNASANIDNTVQEIVNSGTSDIFLYTPNFDPNNQSDLAAWINDPGKYGAAGGYTRKQLKLPAGEVVGEVKYQGSYNASTTRLDLGAVYDATDWLSFGLDFENFGNSSFKLKGSGLASYISYRDYNAAEINNLQDLLLPGGGQTVDLLPDRWITTFEAGGTKLFLEPEKTYALPRRMRLGLALKRPFLLALDYEQNQNAITIPGSGGAADLIISNLSFVRLGFESRLFFLPCWLRTGLTFVLKPSLSGGDPATVDSINKYFAYGVLPTSFDLGSSLNLFSYELNGAFGVNAMPFINLLQLDTQNADPSRMVYYSWGVKKDAWELNYLSAVDTLSTAAAYSNKPAPAVGSKSFEISDLKYVQTLGVTYRF